MTIREIVFWLLLLDSISANLTFWIGSNWYVHHFRLISRMFPPGKGWAAYYLVLVLWIGWLTYA